MSTSPPRHSPERKEVRKLEKENSPVRNFLDDEVGMNQQSDHRNAKNKAATRLDIAL